MNILQTFGSANFKTTADGRRAFFPYGSIGSGRIVDSDETYKRLVSHQARSVVFWLVTMPFVASEFGWFGLLAYFIVWALCVDLLTRRLTKDLEVASERFGFGDAEKSLARLFALGRFTLWFLVFVGLVFFSLGILVLIDAVQIWWMGVGLAALGAAFVGLSLRQLHGHAWEAVISQDNGRKLEDS
ncbi:MAG: hypothetical protein ACXWF0_00530 [Usitatibacter sp.]